MEPDRQLVGGAILLVWAFAACGSQHPTAPTTTRPPEAIVDWPGLESLYEDPLYRALPGLLDDQPIADLMESAMAVIRAGIHSKDIATVREGLATLHRTREVYAMRPGSDPRVRPALIALSLFEIRGSAYIHVDSLQRHEVQFISESGQ